MLCLTRRIVRETRRGFLINKTDRGHLDASIGLFSAWKEAGCFGWITWDWVILCRLAVARGDFAPVDDQDYRQARRNDGSDTMRV
eukprot:1390857-Amorphochlora_amoeboformis.AAC.1